MVKYNTSLPYDKVFWSQDIRGSIAFARANLAAGILTQTEFSAIEKGFAQIAEEWRTGTFVEKENDEDIHTGNERRLSELLGKEVGGKLHTGRSRNEQIATDMRLWLRDELRVLEGYLEDFIKCGIGRSEREIDVLVSIPFSSGSCAHITSDARLHPPPKSSTSPLVSLASISHHCLCLRARASTRSYCPRKPQSSWMWCSCREPFQNRPRSHG